MSRYFIKLILSFVTQILFTVLQVRPPVTIAEPELNLNNLTLQHLFASPLIFKENLTQVSEDAHVVSYVDEWVEPTVHFNFHTEIITHPIMTAYVKQPHYSNLTGNYNATFTKRAPVYLYEPKLKSPGHPPEYRYDSHNPLYIVETEQNACYEVTCTSFHLIKWVTNILVKDVAGEFESSCGNWMYMNSRRLNDKYDFKNQSDFKDSPAAGRNKANASSLYTIRFVFRAYESNMGVLTCQNIANSSSATHYYFTDYPVFEKTTDLIRFVKQPETFSSFNRDSNTEVPDAFYSTMELFWESSNGSSFVVPCRGSRLSVEPNLTLTLLHESSDGKFHNNATQLWDSANGSLVSKLQYEGDPLSALQYDPVKGFTLNHVFQYFLFGYVPATRLVKIYFNCAAEDGSRMQFNVYPFKKAKPKGLSLNDAKITEVVHETQLLGRLNGCYYIQASDQFVSTVQRSLNYNFNQQYAIKLIQCSCPYECDIVRQCLDFQHGICYSKRCEIQFASNRLLNPYIHGLLRCIDYSIEYGSRAIYEYTFVGLDKRRYLLSNDVPTKAVIYLEEIPAVLYTNVETTFRCQIAHFMLVPNIKFALVFENKTILELNNKEGIDTTRTNDGAESDSDLYNTRDVSSMMNTNGNLGVGWRDIHLNLTAAAVGIMCLAPFHNSTQWAKVTRSFVTKGVYKPQISRTGRHHIHYFVRGDNNFKLDCKADGAPHPTIEWKVPAHYYVPKKHPNLTQTTDKNNNSVLKFPPMKQLFAGTYSCYASNPYGNDSYDYFVIYEGKDIKRETWETVAVGFMVIILVFVMLGFLWFSFFQYERPEAKNGKLNLFYNPRLLGHTWVRWRKTLGSWVLGADIPRQDLTLEEVNEFENGRMNGNLHIHSEGQIKINKLPFDKKFIINSNDLMIENGVVLGEGQFGIVYRGLLKGIPVAVKTLKSTNDVTVVKGLLCELKVMSYIGDHAHIVHFYGAVIEKIQKRVVEVVMELSPLGNLLDYLRKLGLKNSSLVTSQVHFCNLLVNDIILKDKTQTSPKATTTLDLIDWCRQIASGMDFISSKRVYHGDLAARNILIFSNKTLKITDFGFAKKLYSSPCYAKKQMVAALPWRWMSIESLLFLEFSIQSDVWAFGVTMWEIFSLGQTPYPGLTWSQEFIQFITTGMRIAKPDNCPKLIYDRMLQCWDTNPEKRPQFWELVQFFDHHLQPFDPLGDTNQRRTMQEMNTIPTASTSTGSTSRTCSNPNTVDGQRSDVAKSLPVVYTVL